MLSIALSTPNNTAIDDDSFKMVSKLILDQFPSNVDRYSPSLLTSRWIAYLYQSLSSLQLDAPADVSGGLEACLRDTLLETPVLNALWETVQGSGSGKKFSSTKRRTRSNPNQTDEAKLVIDAKPFVRMDIKVPTTMEAVRALGEGILRKQKSILKVLARSKLRT